MIRTPATTIAPATTSAVIESKAAMPVIWTRRGRRARRRRSERRRAGAPRPPRAPAIRGALAWRIRTVETARLASTEMPITAMPTPSDSTLGADHQPMGRLEDDDPGADQDQHPLDRRRQALDLLVAVGVVGVGRLVGFADRDEGDHRGDQVDQRVDRLGQDRDRAGDRAGRELDRDQGGVGGDRERPPRRFWSGSSSAAACRVGRQVRGQHPRRAAPVADLVLFGV